MCPWPWAKAAEACTGAAAQFPSPQVLRSLNKTYKNMKRKPVTVDLDPKAVTCDELFGVIHPSTREWKDGENSSACEQPVTRGGGRGQSWCTGRCSLCNTQPGGDVRGDLSLGFFAGR